MIKRKKPLKRTPLKRKPYKKKKKLDPQDDVSYFRRKKPAKATADSTQRQMHILDLNLCQMIWDAREHVCKECEEPLPNTWHKENFSHNLPKGTYKNMRYCAANIDLVCFDCHQKWEFGDRKSMKIYNEKHRQMLKEIDKSIPHTVKTVIERYGYFLVHNKTSNWSS